MRIFAHAVSDPALLVSWQFRFCNIILTQVMSTEFLSPQLLKPSERSDIERERREEEEEAALYILFCQGGEHCAIRPPPRCFKLDDDGTGTRGINKKAERD